MRREIGLIKVISIGLFKKEFIDKEHDEAVDTIYNDTGRFCMNIMVLLWSSKKIYKRVI
jgi:hypothetical protein